MTDARTRTAPSTRGGLGRAAGLAALLLAAACSGTTGNGFFAPGGDGGSGGSGGGGGGGGSGGGGGGTTGSLLGDDGGGGVGSVSSADCPASAKLVYVTGEGSTLYSFYPPTFTFKLIGTLSCLGADYTPTHMTVDRTGTAWVAAWVTDPSSALYQTSSLYTASTANAQCAKVQNWVPQPGGNFSDFALTFIGTTNATDTTLYLLGATGGSGGEFQPGSQAVLGSFDTQSGKLTTIGMPAVGSAGGDMTTNGDGTLYYLQDTTQLDLYEINPSNAAIEKSFSPTAPGGGDQALAYYGGSFYAFEMGVVYQFDTVTQTTKQLGNAPIQVTGAGQSTCVPTSPPSAQ